MARKKTILGTCRICCQTSELTFEHVPPKRAYNKNTVVEYLYAGTAIRSHQAGRKIQGGAGSYTLCSSCNNDTGSWYASEYVKWAYVAADALRKQNAGGAVALGFKGAYPARFLKQVVTCFFSVIDTPDGGFAAANPGLARYVLDRNEMSLPSDWRFFLRLYRPVAPRTALRRYPIAGSVTIQYTKNANGTWGAIRATGSSIFSEYTHPPFMLTMTYKDPYPKSFEITSFAKYRNDEKVDLDMLLYVGLGSSPWPGSTP